MVLAGDGVGPEIVAAAQRVLAAVGERFGFIFEYERGPARRLRHRRARRRPWKTGSSSAAGACDAVLLGAVGGPKWDTTDPHKPRPEQGLLGMRQGAGAVRQPAAGQELRRPGPQQHPQGRGHRRRRPHGRARAHRRRLLRQARARRRHGLRHDDLQPRPRSSGWSTTPSGWRAGRRRLVHSVDKANVLESSRLWRAVALARRARATPTSSCATCWSTTAPCSSSATPGSST